MPIRPLVVLGAICTLCAPLQAHEFWIEPEAYTVDPGAEFRAGFRNGETFEGSSFSYIPSRSVRLDMAMDGPAEPIPARIGDSPAIQVDAPAQDGLWILVHETGDMLVTYTERDGRSGWERFSGFVEHKDMDAVLAAHDARGLPREGIREAYRRFAKALVAVGGGAGADRNMGLRTEIVAGLNPYTDDLSDGLPVQVFLDGVPKGDAQVEMFARGPDGEVAVSIHKADAEGRVTLPVAAGHEYLLDSVAILPLEVTAEGDPAWLSLWAALTFAVPEA